MLDHRRLRMPEISLVVPCYNEAGHLERSVRETLRIIDALQLDAEVVFVDDASGDETVAVIDRLIAAHPTRAFSRILHAKNVGRGGAVRAGIRVARGTYVGFIDIDLEVAAFYLLPTILALREGYDVVTVRRVYPITVRSLHRHFMSRGYRALRQWMFPLPITDSEAGYKFFRRDRILPVLATTEDERWFWDTEILVRAERAGLRLYEFPAVFVRNEGKRSTVRPVRDSLEYLWRLRRFRARRP